ncbi:MAG: zinc metalloprotease HtpX [Hyphomicrobiaceae bacterium]
MKAPVLAAKCHHIHGMRQIFTYGHAARARAALLDSGQLAEHRRRNDLHSLLLIGSIAAIVLLAGAMLWSLPGAIVAVMVVVGLALLSPRVPPETVMRLYRAQRVDRRHGAQLLHMVEAIADRAELRRHPDLYVIPSSTLNAFATGTRDHAAIAITDGLLRRLDLREIAGVIAHEISHIRNNDLSVMAIADGLTRFTQVLAYVGVFLAVVSIPAAVFGHKPFPLWGIALLYLAPTLTSLLQMGLSRAREYDADLEAASLTGDPQGLASALSTLERHQGRFWEDLMLPVPARRIPHPSLLRSHPATADRIRRLQQLTASQGRLQPINYGREPLFTLVGLGPGNQAPRQRPFGFYY